MIPSKNEPRIYNSIVINNYLKLLRAKYPKVDIDDLLSYAGIERHEAEDPLYWFTQTHASRFHERLSGYFEDHLQIAREAGRYVCSEISLGLLKYLSINILGVGVIYKHVAEYANKLTKTTVFKPRRISSNKYELEVTLLPGFEEKPYQEQNRIGVIEAGPLLFSNKLADVKSSKIGRTTTYTIQWDRPRSEIITRYIFLVLFLFLPTAALVYFYNDIPYLKYVSVFFLFSSFILLYLKQRFRYKELSNVHETHTNIVNQTIDKFYSDYEDLTRLNEIGNIINKNNQLDIILKEISKLISSDYHKGAFFISDDKKGFVSVQHLYGYSPDLKRISIDLIPFSHNIDIYKPNLFDNMAALSANDPLKPYAGYFNAADFPLCWLPITFDRSLVGFFFLSPQKDKLPMRQRDLHFLMGISSRIASGIHRLYAFASLVENDRLKSDFITTASHELRTPVQIILLGLSNLNNNIHVKKEAEKDLDIIKSGTFRLREIISNILDLSTVGSLKDYKIDLYPASEVLSFIKPEMINLITANNHQVFFEYDESVLLRCDVKNFPTAIINLFSNSCKYTAPGGKILLKITDIFGETAIDIIDNGYGIPANIQDKVFIKFFQADTSKNETLGGCGIGLSITKEILKAHGGEISITSPLNPRDYPELGLSSERLGTRARIHLPK
jgi:signal transduction histidine kinase